MAGTIFSFYRNNIQLYIILNVFDGSIFLTLQRIFIYDLILKKEKNYSMNKKNIIIIATIVGLAGAAVTIYSKKHKKHQKHFVAYGTDSDDEHQTMFNYAGSVPMG